MSQAPEAAVVLGFRDFIKKLLRARSLTYEALARKLGTPEHLMERRVKQLDHVLNDPADSTPRASIVKAIERALDINLEPEDYGWDAEQP